VSARLDGESRDDISLVNAARQGDRSAFGQLYDRYSRIVHGILLSRVPRSEVEDLVQEVFMLALPRLHSLRDTGHFGAWLATITRNRANDYHRRARTEVEFTDRKSGDAIVGGMTISPQDQDNEALSILAVIRSLPEAYRETLILRLVEGMTGPEIAARTGLTAGSVRVNLHRGMQQLREKLGCDSNKTQKGD
jgi:RNA polymerase sigma-70 factor (ECF subfamily)